MLRSLNETEQALFIAIEQSAHYCKSTFNVDVELDNIHTLIKEYLLPSFKFSSENWILKDDLISLLSFLSSMSTLREIETPWGNIKVKGSSFPFLANNDKKVDLAFYSAARNLLSTANLLDEGSLVELVNIAYFSNKKRSFTASSMVCKYIEKQLARAREVSLSRTSQFAQSAHYMGSKRDLSGFLIEGISSILPANGVVIDLMCGSGAAASAFNKFWRTIASDLQEFCQNLALVQGGGFSNQEADILLRRILPMARDHALKLREQLDPFIECEDKMFRGDIGPDLLENYLTFINSFPTYPNGMNSAGWEPVWEAERRKNDPKMYPYCLFTSYFANVFFGLRQCIEIDSLRFAIDQLENVHERHWALGTLIATISALGTTYAGHFAQPKDLNRENLSKKGYRNFSKILEQRANSIMHEFSVRLWNLSKESENTSRAIEIIPGPWFTALQTIENLFINEPIVVYLDAPYKREEYSRYYHVLETLVSYAYPNSMGRGRMPEKGTRERPRSEFFTRSEQLITNALFHIITDILRRGWTCAWSYSDAGEANIVTVLKQVQERIECTIKSFAAPYTYKPQGKREKNLDEAKETSENKKKAKEVTEYLVLISPKKI